MTVNADYQIAPAGAPFQTSPRTLAKACAAALLLAVLILLLVVLPAERGMDPTGFGAAVGLTQMRGEKSAASAAAGAAASAAASYATAAATPATAASAAPAIWAVPDPRVIAKGTPMRADEMSVLIKPHSGVEIKAQMLAGDALVFHWEASAPVKMDMHGEPPNAGETFTRYWMQSELQTAQGAFTAPFDGRHGWYFRNRGETDVTVKLRTSGFYAALFQPK